MTTSYERLKRHQQRRREAGMVMMKVWVPKETNELMRALQSAMSSHGEVISRAMWAYQRYLVQELGQEFDVKEAPTVGLGRGRLSMEDWVTVERISVAKGWPPETVLKKAIMALNDDLEKEDGTRY